jgi:hypothetical protein
MGYGDKTKDWIEEFGVERFLNEAVVTRERPGPGNVSIVHDPVEYGRILGTKDALVLRVINQMGARMKKEELKDRLVGNAWGASGDNGTGDGDTGGGDAGDILSELDTDPAEEDKVKKSIRKLDQGAIDSIRAVTGASSDAEAVRKAVTLAEHMLVQD